MPHVLGVDLGGTTVSAAIAGDDGRPEMVALGDRSIIVPAVVHQRDGASLVTGEVAARRGELLPVGWASTVVAVIACLASKGSFRVSVRSSVPEPS